MDDYLGLMVISLAGRDKGRIAAVVSVVDDRYVCIADGRARRTETPKKKKLKHIRMIAGLDEALIRLEPDNMTNKVIRERIRQIEESLGNAGKV